MTTQQIVKKAFELGLVIPAFNIPYLPMMEPVANAVADENAVAMIQVARLEWEKFESRSLEHVAEEYAKHQKPGHTLLHLDHVPVIDEDHLEVDYMAILERAIKAGYKSVMVDASRLSLEGNIEATARAAQLAHAAGLPIEAELGAVMGHETSQQAIPYEEIFRKKMGFTDTQEAVRFVKETGCDWLSVAVGSVHGAIADGLKDQKKPTAKLDVQHIAALREALGIPLVLHGGSGIDQQYISQGVAAGIAKINVGTEIRQPYERKIAENGSVAEAQDVVYRRTVELIRDFLHVKDSAARLMS
ncbi:MAG: class II fructose-bisphosphate aldolase [Clostridiales bacterium]|jgi:fructose-bisphosphate aldolase class II|nr:class II fructose-bisphosphate aldolase [Clostridiales bacterium]